MTEAEALERLQPFDPRAPLKDFPRKNPEWSEWLEAYFVWREAELPRAVERLKTQIDRLLDDPDLAAEIGRNGVDVPLWTNRLFEIELPIRKALNEEHPNSLGTVSQAGLVLHTARRILAGELTRGGSDTDRFLRRRTLLDPEMYVHADRIREEVRRRGSAPTVAEFARVVWAIMADPRYATAKARREQVKHLPDDEEEKYDAHTDYEHSQAVHITNHAIGDGDTYLHLLIDLSRDPRDSTDPEVIREVAAASEVPYKLVEAKS